MTTIDTATLERQPRTIALWLRAPVDHRLRLAKKLLPLVGVGVAVYVLLPRVARASSTLSSLSAPSWPWRPYWSFCSWPSATAARRC